jgi:hypothetical protein
VRHPAARRHSRPPQARRAPRPPTAAGSSAAGRKIVSDSRCTATPWTRKRIPERAGAGGWHGRLVAGRQRAIRRRRLHPRVCAALEPRPHRPVDESLRRRYGPLRRRVRVPECQRPGHQHAVRRPAVWSYYGSPVRGRVLRALGLAKEIATPSTALG